MATDPATFVLGSGHLPVDSVKLGRLVRDIAVPQDSKYDPILAPDWRLITQELRNFTGSADSSRSKSFLMKLTSLLSLSYSKQCNRTSFISSTCVKHHQMDNSEKYYQGIIERDSTREWIETELQDGGKICLLVGYITLQDAVVVETDTALKSSDISLHAPITEPLLAGVLGTVPAFIPRDALDAVIELSVKSGINITSKFDVPGEKVFALQYRLVKQSFLSSKNLSNALQKTQWKAFNKLRRAQTVETYDIVEAVLGEFAFEEDDEDEEQWTKVTKEGVDFYI